jgi:hypothetical protein
VIDPPSAPAFAARSLDSVVPSLLAALGAPGFTDRLEVGSARSACLLLIDGLGAELLHTHAADAPFLSSLAAGTSPIEVGFPATTAVSLATLGTGQPPGVHGIVGYVFAAPGGALLNALTWKAPAGSEGTDARTVLPPERLQPRDTLAQRAALAGVRMTSVAPSYQEHSGLTRAALRGAPFRAARALGDLAAAALDASPGELRYVYHGDLDMLGHRYGPGSLPWRLQLTQIDQLAASIAAHLPPGTALAITADHGMVELDTDNCVDLDDDPALQSGVRAIGGEIRARHVYVERGAHSDVLSAWQERLGDRAWVLSQEEAIAAGWFGPQVSDAVRERIGDVLAALRGRAGALRRVAEPLESSLIGQHGSLTPAERLVPFLLVRG